MKKLTFLGLILSFITITFFSCEKEELNTPKVNLAEKNSIYKRGGDSSVNEINVGEYHNSMINFVFDDLSTMNSAEINSKISTSSYVVGKMKEYCVQNNLKLPNDSEINLYFSQYKSTELSTTLSNDIFSNEQETILTECFNSLNLINEDLSKNDLLLSILNTNLKKVKFHNESKGKMITIATINQLKASSQLWIVENKINFLNNNNVTIMGNKPSNGQILGADAKGLVTALVFGGAYTPIGWCGSMFVGAGASIGSYMGGSNWWPY